MLCIEGISMALKTYLGVEPQPVFKTIVPEGRPLEKLVVQPEVFNFL